MNDHTRSHHRHWILGAVCLCALTLPLSFTGGAIATPAIAREFSGSAIGLAWVTNAFMLSFGSLLMAAGALADEYGRKRLFLCGVTLFTLVSLALSVAPSLLWLDLLRAVQGIGAALTLSSGSAALAQEYEGHAQARAFSLLGTSFGVGLAFGPLAAGTLIELFGWRSVFLLIALVSASALVIAALCLRETRNPDAQGLDWGGTLTFSGALSLLTFGLIQTPQSGWLSAEVVLALLGCALLFLAFLVIELRSSRPMLDLRLFIYPRFIGVQFLPIGTCYCFIILVVLLPLRFIGITGLSEIQAGLLMIALSIPLVLVPFAAVFLSRWVNAGFLCGMGFLIAAVGLYQLSQISVTESGSVLMLPMVLIGIGAAIPWGLMDGLSISVVPTDRAGMAVGIFNTTRVASEGIALAMTTAVLAALLSTTLGSALVEQGAQASAAVLGETAQRLATGDLFQARALLPDVAPTVLVASYGNAFERLLQILCAITVGCALLTFACLCPRTPRAATCLPTPSQ